MGLSNIKKEMDDAETKRRQKAEAEKKSYADYVKKSNAKASQGRPCLERIEPSFWHFAYEFSELIGSKQVYGRKKIMGLFHVSSIETFVGKSRLYASFTTGGIRDHVSVTLTYDNNCYIFEGDYTKVEHRMSDTYFEREKIANHTARISNTSTQPETEKWLDTQFEQFYRKLRPSNAKWLI